MSVVAIVYEYDPFGSKNDNISDVEEKVWPLDRLTYQVVPDGMPCSENICSYWAGV